jgi:hypothetical protein
LCKSTQGPEFYRLLILKTIFINHKFTLKKNVSLLILICLILPACNKDKNVTVVFVPKFTRDEYNTYFDSISTAVINYSDLSEIKDSSELNNPEIFNTSITSGKPFSLTLTSDHSFVIKKFDLMDKKGSVIFYIPYGTFYYYSDGSQYPTQGLPLLFKAHDGTIIQYFEKK